MTRTNTQKKDIKDLEITNNVALILKQRNIKSFSDDFYERIGASKYIFNQILVNKQQPTLDVAVKLAFYFNLPLSDLMIVK